MDTLVLYLFKNRTVREWRTRQIPLERQRSNISIAKGSEILLSCTSFSCSPHSCCCDSKTVESKSLNIATANANAFWACFSLWAIVFAEKGLEALQVTHLDLDSLILVIFMKLELFIWKSSSSCRCDDVILQVKPVTVLRSDHRVSRTSPSTHPMPEIKSSTYQA